MPKTNNEHFKGGGILFVTTIMKEKLGTALIHMV